MSDSRVPTELIAPIVRRYLIEQGQDEYDGMFERREAKRQGTPMILSPLRILREKSGINKNLLNDVLWERQLTVEFNVADRLLCAMHLVHLWRESPLKEVYESLDLSEPGWMPAEESVAA